jgi:hypothetical protein
MAFYNYKKPETNAERIKTKERIKQHSENLLKTINRNTVD